MTTSRTVTVIAVAFATVVSGCSSMPGGEPGEARSGSEGLHEVAEHPLEERAVPGSISESAWTWEGPRAVGVEEVLPVPTGAVLRLTDGVVALDPVTGEEVWTFRLPGAEADAATSPDGAAVAVIAQGTLVLLNSSTGEELDTREYDTDGGSGLELSGVGLVADTGMVAATEDPGSGLEVRLRPWAEQDEGWTAGPLLCADGSAGTGIEDGFLTPTGVVVVFGCSGGTSAMVSLDASSGQEQWRLVPGEDYSSEFSENEGPERETFAVVGQIAVLQNLARQRGTVVIDTRTGQVLTDSLPNETGADTVRVLSDGYVVRRTEDTDGKTRAWYELRDFSGEVLKTVPIDNARLDALLPLEETLVHLEWGERGAAPELVVFPWEEGEPSERIASPVHVETAALISVWRAEEATGPAAFQAVPGAVLLLEYTPGGFYDRVAGFV
ncbi:PQQ-binding-like beta-propeller repeat protein [Nocardiopsis sp. N85]|uniref:outer membrane protein assembly factor BamB family protein n=1 Tax=Nocardiopsis sp. N85 TaxID=3029400 RepID=UPI00237F554A|nr:PQQ-binding-like beta-propeller repeat protein [Nocardiopsis sp. N85]MDE3723544.1 PQQ-binding-like beta-propeller repeat protein [Nocardiopsis sp. N85]